MFIIHRYKNVRLGYPETWNWNQSGISVPYWRIYWNSKGGAFIKNKTEELELCSDFVVAIPPKTQYSTRTEEGTDHFHVEFSVDHPYSLIKPGFLRFQSRPLLTMAKALATELKTIPRSYRLDLQVGIYLSEVLLAIPPSQIPSCKELDFRVQNAINRLTVSPCVSNEELAERLNMSRSAFLNLFRAETGTSPKKFSRQKRLEHSCCLLHFSEKSIDQIAEECGFCDRYHFSREFSREYKCGPAAFRDKSSMLNQ